MNTLLQNQNNIIGSIEAIEELKTKNHARILLVSDSHGKEITLINIVKKFGPECDALILCGDTAHDLSALLEQAWTNEELKNAVPPVFAFVQGNGDSSRIPVTYEVGKENPASNTLSKNLVFIPSHQILTINNINFYVTHGHNEGIDWGFEKLGMTMKFENCKVGLFGHSHIAGQFNEENYTFINPGSCSRPRGGQPNGFAIVTVEKNICDTAFIKIDYPLSDHPEYSLYTPIISW